MNAKFCVFVICVKAIMYLLLHNLHDCTFNLTKVVPSQNHEDTGKLTQRNNNSSVNVSFLGSNLYGFLLSKCFSNRFTGDLLNGFLLIGCCFSIATSQLFLLFLI